MKGKEIINHFGASTTRTEKMNIPDYKVLRYRAKRHGEQGMATAEQWCESRL
ncbi:MAG: hypothetical protein PWQ56_468 [Patescibacteria group bacterium]|nr:hypothetical protein [Patescibacteria group bacterium]